MKVKKSVVAGLVAMTMGANVQAHPIYTPCKQSDLVAKWNIELDGFEFCRIQIRPNGSIQQLHCDPVSIIPKAGGRKLTPLFIRGNVRVTELCAIRGAFRLFHEEGIGEPPVEEYGITGGFMDAGPEKGHWLGLVKRDPDRNPNDSLHDRELHAYFAGAFR